MVSLPDMNIQMRFHVVAELPGEIRFVTNFVPSSSTFSSCLRSSGNNRSSSNDVAPKTLAPLFKPITILDIEPTSNLQALESCPAISNGKENNSASGSSRSNKKNGTVRSSRFSSSQKKKQHSQKHQQQTGVNISSNLSDLKSSESQPVRITQLLDDEGRRKSKHRKAMKGTTSLPKDHHHQHHKATDTPFYHQPIELPPATDYTNSIKYHHEHLAQSYSMVDVQTQTWVRNWNQNYITTSTSTLFTSSASAVKTGNSQVTRTVITSKDGKIVRVLERKELRSISSQTDQVPAVATSSSEPEIITVSSRHASICSLVSNATTLFGNAVECASVSREAELHSGLSTIFLASKYKENRETETTNNSQLFPDTPVWVANFDSMQHPQLLPAAKALRNGDNLPKRSADTAPLANLSANVVKAESRPIYSNPVEPRCHLKDRISFLEPEKPNEKPFREQFRSRVQELEAKLKFLPKVQKAELVTQSPSTTSGSLSSPEKNSSRDHIQTPSTILSTTNTSSYYTAYDGSKSETIPFIDANSDRTDKPKQSSPRSNDVSCNSWSSSLSAKHSFPPLATEKMLSSKDSTVESSSFRTPEMDFAQQLNKIDMPKDSFCVSKSDELKVSVATLRSTLV